MIFGVLGHRLSNGRWASTYPTKLYIDSFKKCGKLIVERNQASISDYAAISFHIPYTKMGKKSIVSSLCRMK